MAWSSPKTWAYKETLASSDLNTYVSNNLSYLKDLFSIVSGHDHNGGTDDGKSIKMVTANDYNVKIDYGYNTVVSTGTKVNFHFSFSSPPTVVCITNDGANGSGVIATVKNDVGTNYAVLQTSYSVINVYWIAVGV